jgi:hypothetical protein
LMAGRYLLDEGPGLPHQHAGAGLGSVQIE